ncbi:MAG: hypothetical protein ABI600_13445 [Luteolibacter sp.]
MKRSHATLLAGTAIMGAAIAMIPHNASLPAGDRSLARAAAAQKNARLPDNHSSKTPRVRAVVNRQNLPELPPPVESPYPQGASENEQWTVDRIAGLDRLSAADDSASLREILAELRNPLPEIRRAALSAVRAFSSRESIPYLELMLRETRDSADQQDLTDAIEYLQLPTMAESLERQSIPAPGGNQDPP